MIYVDDHEPAHVHVRGRGSAKIAFAGGAVRVISDKGMSKADVKRALDAVKEEQARLLAAWSRIHG